ncbi:MAG: LiaF-related protein [Clostridiaceae bacterium]|nr:LiaF-related protein [Clostridiaceae bacterium]
MNKKLSNVLWGLAFIVVGVGIAGNVFNLWNFRFFFRGWWTLFIIVPCVISMIENGVKTSNLIGFMIGALLLVDELFYVHIAGKLIFPIILVLIGFSIIFKGHFHVEKRENHYGDKSYEINMGNSKKGNGFLNVVAIFWGNEKRIQNEEVLGADCAAVFGGIDLDLRDAIINHDISIDSLNLFGGTDIYLPNNVNVKVNSLGIFGGIDNKTYHPYIEGAPTVYVNGTCLFGGIDIK